ncbi:MAG: hypothetical protein VKP63_02105, partial [Cyanobacteriota bacterium]|nr:hypothetical protein [Cyanobacteriota bacterium]
TFTWTNGTPTLTASGVTSGLQHNNTDGGPSGIGEGFSFTVPANTIAAQLRLFTTNHNGRAQLTATLADGSAPVLTLDTTEIGGNRAHTFDINYQANSNTTLTLKYLLTSESIAESNVAIQGVSTTFVVPGPLPILGLASAFGMSRQLRRRIASNPRTV